MTLVASIVDGFTGPRLSQDRFKAKMVNSVLRVHELQTKKAAGWHSREKMKQLGLTAKLAMCELLFFLLCFGRVRTICDICFSWFLKSLP